MEKWIKKLKQTKTETWIVLLLAGVLLLVISLPSEKTEKESGEGSGSEKRAAVSDSMGEKTEDYERKLEKRVEEFLSAIEGVGEASVMITLESAGEKILKTDDSTEQSLVKEQDSEGGERVTEDKNMSSQTVLSGSENRPYVTEEKYPKVTGIVICAEGGADSFVKAEISGAMEALFDLPVHKIKVLKKVKAES